MKFIDIEWNLITGVMLGIEYVDDKEGGRHIVLDLFIVRILVSWGEL